MDNPTFATAIVTEVAENGLKLKFPGEEIGGAKVYPCNAGCSFEVGDRVVVYPDSGTYIVMFPLGAPGSKGGSLPPGGAKDQVLVKASSADGDAEWVNNRPTALYPTARGSASAVSLSGDNSSANIRLGRAADKLAFFGAQYRGPVLVFQGGADAAKLAELLNGLEDIGLVKFW